MDFVVINYDHDNEYKDGNVRNADKTFVVFQSILDLIIVLSYIILFVFFLKLIYKRNDLIFMKKNVLVFFIFMLVILTI